MQMTNLPKCLNCGGDSYINYECKYCGTQNHEYKILIDLIKPYDDVNEFYNIEIFSKLIKGIKLDEKCDKILNLFLKLKMINDSYLPDGIVIANLLKDKKCMSYDTFELFLSRAVEKLMREQVSKLIPHYNPTCRIINFDDKVTGNAYKEVLINIDKKNVYRFYEEADIFSLITIYHEIRHVIQNITIKSGKFETWVMPMIKDKVLDSEFLVKNDSRTYYEENYKCISFEVDAFASSLVYIKNFLENYGMKLSEEFIIHYVEKNIKDYYTNIRAIEGEEFSLDELFDSVIEDKPEVLDTYPQLNIEYKILDGKVIRKDKEELLEFSLQSSDEKIKDYINEIINKYYSVKK